jgi:chemotaxis protein methyltransferase CheR
MSDELLIDELPGLSDFVAGAIGLHFPPSRWGDLERGMRAAARELDEDSPAICAQRFISGAAVKREIEILAAHLTVGETYFLRERKVFEVLGRKIIPEICRRREESRLLRIWSAACCTGEEAYSIAITLHQAIPDIANWNITLLATDINARFLRKAAGGVYGGWSFRQVPAGFRERYFRQVGDEQWEIAPHIKRLVRFAPLNLAQDIYPTLANESNAMDVIFCRNVLMYFTPGQVRKVVGNLHRAQTDGGWLIAGSGELSQMASAPYTAHSDEGFTYYRKFIATAVELPAARPAPVALLSIPARPQVVNVPKAGKSADPVPIAQKRHDKLRRAARRLANRGRLNEALRCCERWIMADRVNPASHYLRAVIQQELGDSADAVKSLRGALYLDPNFALAHFALGNIERNRGRVSESIKHLQNVRKLLARYSPDEVVPESEGITAERLIEIVNSLLEMEVAA